MIKFPIGFRYANIAYYPATARQLTSTSQQSAQLWWPNPLSAIKLLLPSSICKTFYIARMWRYFTTTKTYITNSCFGTKIMYHCQSVVTTCSNRLLFTLVSVATSGSDIYWLAWNIHTIFMKSYEDKFILKISNNRSQLDLKLFVVDDM